MSVEGCCTECEDDLLWEDEYELETTWEGRSVSQNNTKFIDTQDRIENVYHQVKPLIDVATNLARYTERERFMITQMKRQALSQHNASQESCFLLEDDCMWVEPYLSHKNIEHIVTSHQEDEATSDRYEIILADYRPDQLPTVLQCGLKKSLKKGCHKAGKFWREHKVEIIVSAGVVSAIAVVALVAPYFAGPVATAGGAILDRVCNDNPSGPSDNSPSVKQPLTQHFPPRRDQTGQEIDSVPKNRYLLDRELTDEEWRNLPSSSYSIERERGSHLTYPSSQNSPFDLTEPSLRSYQTFYPSRFQEPFSLSSLKPIPELPQTLQSQLSLNSSPPKTNSSTDEKWNRFLRSPYLVDRGIKPEASASSLTNLNSTHLPPLTFPSPDWSKTSIYPPPFFELSPRVSPDTSQPSQIPIPSEPVQSTTNGSISETLSSPTLREKVTEYVSQKWHQVTEGTSELFSKGKQFCKDLKPASSERLPTLGPSNKDIFILGINGMNVNKEEGLKNQAYLKSLVPNHGVDYIHNCSHSAVIDILEICGLNLFSYSPNNATLLRESFQKFHETHKDNPNKKLLAVGHSQGCIHISNGLKGLPPEVRDRIIVVAIAPAKIIPAGTCYASFNYASKRDIVPHLEVGHASFFDSSETGVSAYTQILLEHREQLILLDPHPGATGIDHDFQSPTFHDTLQRHLDDYIEKNGEYTERPCIK